MSDSGPDTQTKVKDTLTEGQVDAVRSIEQNFYQHGGIPTDEKIADQTGLTLQTVKSYWKVESFRKALIHRGIPLDSGKSNDLLTLPQLNLANKLLNIHDVRSTREKLQETGVTSQQYHAWLRQPAFRTYLQKRGEELFASNDHEAYTALLGAVRGQDVSALKLFFEMRGIYNPKLQVDVNIEVVMVRVVEIIARHVRDPLVLQAIATDLESLDQPGLPPVELPSPAQLVQVEESSSWLQ